MAGKPESEGTKKEGPVARVPPIIEVCFRILLWGSRGDDLLLNRDRDPVGEDIAPRVADLQLDVDVEVLRDRDIALLERQVVAYRSNRTVGGRNHYRTSVRSTTEGVAVARSGIRALIYFLAIHSVEHLELKARSEGGTLAAEVALGRSKGDVAEFQAIVAPQVVIARRVERSRASR